MALTLRPYQRRAIEDTRAAIQAGARAVLIVCPTGGGKTAIASEIVTRHLAGGSNPSVLWLAHRRELVGQAVKRIAETTSAHIRVIQAGNAAGPANAPINVASIQTLLAKTWRNRLPDASLVVLDESHHFVSEQWSQIAAHYSGALRIGLTATPERADGTPLGDIFESMVVVASVRELIDDGHLVPCVVYAPSECQQQLASSPVDAYQAHGSGGRAIVFCSTVRHAEAAAAEFNAAGIPAASLDGKTAKGRRAALLAQHQSGALRVLTNCQCLTEGYDDPGATVCIIARGCDHAGLFLQIVGRVLRPATGKTHATLIDLRGVVHRHGLPEADREYALDGEAIRAAGRLPPLRQCPQCGAVFPPVRTCPACGFESEPPELPEVRRARLEAIFAAHGADKQRAYFDKLCKQASAAGYAPGFVGHKFRARYGYWPKWPITLVRAS